MNQKLFSSHLKYRSYSHPDRIPYHFSNFQVKAIITQHSNNSPSFDLYKPSVVKGDGKSYHRNPINSYVSKLPDGFFGCLGCRYNSHIFREYKYYRDKVIRSIYWQELWAHVPKTWKTLVLLSYRRSPLIMSFLLLLHLVHLLLNTT